MVNIERYLKHESINKASQAEIEGISNISLVIADINFEVEITEFENEEIRKVRNHLIAFPVYTGSDLGIYSDVDNKYKEETLKS